MSLRREPRSAPAGYASSLTARWYDSQLWLEREALSIALSLAAARPGDVTVDVGAGTGALLGRLAARPAPPRRATGFDASGAMLARVPPLPAGWAVREADARRLPLAEASVDLLTCTYLLHLLDEPARRAVLGEIARVLTPDGRAVLVTLLSPRGLLGRSLLAPLQRVLCRSFRRSSGWCALDPSAELTAAGLAVRRRRVCTRGYASLCLLVQRR